jgi:hypothetical protein
MSPTLGDKRRLKAFENRVLRKIFGSKRDVVTGEWRKLLNGELNDLYFSPNIVRMIKLRRMRWVEYVACMGEIRGLYRVLVEKPWGKRQHGGHWRRWEDNIKIDLREVGCRDMDWIELAQDRDMWRALVNAVITFPFL